SSLMCARSPGSAPGTIAPLAVSPCPCASSATMVTSSTGSAMARGNDEFARPSATEDRRGDEADYRPALRFDRGAHTIAGACKRRFARAPALDEIGAVELELGLDQADEPRPLSGKLKHARQHQSVRNEAHVDGDRVRRVVERGRCERARVDAFERADAWVRRETRIELSVAD